MIPLSDVPLSAAERIAAAYVRAQNAYSDQALNAQVACPLAGGPGVPPHGGNCAKCIAAAAATSHSLMRSAEAEAEVRRFYDEIRDAGNLGGVEVVRLDNEKGNMLGALVCVDQHGATQVLRAFSGFIDESGINTAPGCCPMIPPPSQVAADLLQGQLDTVLTDITAAKVDAEASRVLLHAAKTAQAGGLAAVQANISAIYKGAGTKAVKDAAAALFKVDKAAIEARYAAEQQAFDAAAGLVAPLTAQSKALRDQINEQYSGARILNNFSADPPQTQRQACTDPTKVQDGRTGNCAAPKMIAEARRLDWTPVAVAEIWMGHDQGTQKDFVNGNPGGAYVPSCECCRSILGFSLCGLAEKQLAASAP